MLVVCQSSLEAGARSLLERVIVDGNLKPGPVNGKTPRSNLRAQLCKAAKVLQDQSPDPLDTYDIVLSRHLCSAETVTNLLHTPGEERGALALALALSIRGAQLTSDRWVTTEHSTMLPSSRSRGRAAGSDRQQRDNAWLYFSLFVNAVLLVLALKRPRVVFTQ